MPGAPARAAVAAGLLGCGGPAERPVPRPPAPIDDSGTPVATVPPDPAAVTLAVRTAVDLVPRLSVAPCFDAYRDLLEGASDCPRFLQTGDPSTWLGRCERADGTRFDGVLTEFHDVSWVAEDALREEYLNEFGPAHVPGYAPSGALRGVATGHAIESVAQVSRAAPEGIHAVWTLHADAYALDLSDRGLRARFLRLRGTCDAADAPSLWGVDAPIAPYLDAVQLWVDDGTPDGGAARRTTVDGAVDGLSALAGGGYDTVDFVGVTLLAGSLGAECAHEPTGRIDVRGDRGDLWSLTWPSGACDGCAALQGVGGATLGEVCVDFSAWLRPLAPPVDP